MGTLYFECAANGGKLCREC